MKKPIVGNYNWTPQQMARVNAQREARGQSPLASYNGAQDTQEYDEYYKQIKNRASGIKKSKYDADKEQEGDTSIKDRLSKMSAASQKKRKEDQSLFREKFRKQQMLPKEMEGMRGGVSYSPRSYGSSNA